MFCPNCEVEYREGFGRCSDCDVALVPELPNTLAMEAGAGLQTVWEGSDDQECVRVCQELKKAGIGYEVSRTTESRWMKLSVKWRYAINVAAGDSEEAKKIAEALASPETGADTGESGASELPENAAEDNSEIEENHDSEDNREELPDEPRETSYTEEWYPEDATVEICEQKDESIGSMIEASLLENSIHFRADETPRGAKKLFVQPENARKARGIVREILEAAPPE